LKYTLLFIVITIIEFAVGFFKHLLTTKVLICNMFHNVHRDATLQIDLTDVPGTPCSETDDCHLDLLVENLGRTNYGRPHEFMQKKGLWEGPILLDGKPIDDWEIVPLEFKKKWVQG
jgi:hypothetical protein